MNLADLFRHETDFVTISAGNTLFAAGDSGDSMYILVEGDAEIVVKGRVVETALPGSPLGELALIDTAPRSATVVTRTDCKFAKIDQRRFNFLVQQTPNFAIQIMRIMANRLRNTDQIL